MLQHEYGHLISSNPKILSSQLTTPSGDAASIPRSEINMPAFHNW